MSISVLGCDLLVKRDCSLALKAGICKSGLLGSSLISIILNHSPLPFCFPGVYLGSITEHIARLSLLKTVK